MTQNLTELNRSRLELMNVVNDDLVWLLIWQINTAVVSSYNNTSNDGRHYRLYYCQLKWFTHVWSNKDCGSTATYVQYRQATLGDWVCDGTKRLSSCRQTKTKTDSAQIKTSFGLQSTCKKWFLDVWSKK